MNTPSTKANCMSAIQGKTENRNNNYQPYKGQQNQHKKGSGRQGQKKGGRGGGRGYNSSNNSCKNQSNQSNNSPYLHSTGWNTAEVYGSSLTGRYYDTSFIWTSAINKADWNGINGTSWREGPIYKTADGWLSRQPPPPVYTNFNNLPLPTVPESSQETLVNPPTPPPTPHFVQSPLPALQAMSYVSMPSLQSVSEAMETDSNYYSDSIPDSTGPNTPAEWGQLCPPDCDGSSHWGPCTKAGATTTGFNWASPICNICKEDAHFRPCVGSFCEECQKKHPGECVKTHIRYTPVKILTFSVPYMDPLPIYETMDLDTPFPHPIPYPDRIDETFDARRICFMLKIKATPQVIQHIQNNQFLYLDTGRLKLNLKAEKEPIEVYGVKEAEVKEEKTLDPQKLTVKLKDLKLKNEGDSSSGYKSDFSNLEDASTDSSFAGISDLNKCINKSFYNQDYLV
ncbi:hypothetical protein DL96DRAFT_1708857 [Flagelloscypha sp. PMI_526]|nr:hypothetical protein DL96DRAFT_1708857 [Flagelloscypha sp. PMI_526]